MDAILKDIKEQENNNRSSIKINHKMSQKILYMPLKKK